MVRTNNKMKEVFWQIRVSKSLNDIVERVLEKSIFNTKSEFIRDAVRQKLERMGIKLTNIEEVGSNEVQKNSVQ